MNPIATSIGCGKRANYGTVKASLDIWSSLDSIDSIAQGGGQGSLFALYKRDEDVGRAVAVFLFNIFMGGVFLLIIAMFSVQIVLIANEIYIKSLSQDNHSLQIANVNKWGPITALVIIFIEFFVVGFVALTGTLLILTKLTGCFTECKCDIFFQFVFFAVVLAFSWGSLFEILTLFEALAQDIYNEKQVWKSPIIFGCIIGMSSLALIGAYFIFFNCSVAKKIVIYEGIYHRVLKPVDPSKAFCGTQIFVEASVYKAYICSQCLYDQERRKSFFTMFERISSAWKRESSKENYQNQISTQQNNNLSNLISKAEVQEQVLIDPDTNFLKQPLISDTNKPISNSKNLNKRPQQIEMQDMNTKKRQIQKDAKKQIPQK